MLMLTVLLEYIVFIQLLTPTATVEGEGTKQSSLTAHNDKVQIHQLRAVGLIASSGVCESVVSRNVDQSRDFCASIT